MSILNTDGLTLFGPGSEWLWTMAQFVALTGTGFAIYRQLRALRFGNELSFRKSVDDEWMTERMVRFRLAAMIDVARGRQELTIGMQRVGDLLDLIAYHQNHGLFESNLLLDMGQSFQIWWYAMAAPRIAKARQDYPTRWREWERLAVALAERDRRHGTAIDLSPESLNGPLLQQAIADQIEGLRIEQELRSGTIPTWPIPEAVAKSE